MPSIRVGLGTDLNIKGGNTGIGTITPTARLEVVGGIVAERASSGGISTFKEYQGFNQTLAAIPHDTLIDNGECGSFNSLTGEIKIDGETTISSGSTVEVGKIKTLTVTDRFAVPLGETNNRDAAPEAGTTRFNQDFGTLEFFDGVNWKTVNSYSRGGGAGRVLIAGGDIDGDSDNLSKRIDYLNVNTLGNSINFGELAESARRQSAGCGSETRGIFMGGQGSPANLNEIVYNTIASGGTGSDFGNLLAERQTCGSLSSSTRGISYGAGEPAVNVIEYVEIATTGDSIDFGDCHVTTGRRDHASFASPTRGIAAGGVDNPGALQNGCEFITISSLGNGTDFGDLLNTARGQKGLSNSTRGIIAGGYTPSRIDVIQFITIASTGNATYFGNLTSRKSSLAAGGCSNQIRGICAGGYESPSDGNVNNIDYITISSAGNAQDFGDLSAGSWAQAAACSDSHGGLGGF